MDEVTLTGRLICRTAEERSLVEQYLPEHIELTRHESGCLSFDVVQTEDPLVWRVAECFRDEAAFAQHQERVASSDWGRMTAGIERDYVVSRAD